jgi:hypothetical protein
MSAQRLDACRIRSFVSHEGDVELTVDVGAHRGSSIIIRLDRELRVLSSAISDEFIAQIEQFWSDSLLTVGNPADEVWREAWLSTHLRFEAGHWPLREADPPSTTPSST